MTTNIEFPDVSFYQEPINWNVMSSRTKNIIIRLGQGNWADHRFESYYPAAKAYGLSRGVYFFADDRYTVDEHVSVIKRMLDKHGLPEARVWIDWEDLSYHSDGTHKGVRHPVSIMRKVEQLFPSLVVGMYTGYYWFEDHTNPTADKSDFLYLKEHPLWLAQYTADGSSDVLQVPSPWIYPPELHQYDTPPIGSSYGVGSEEIDMNRVLKNQDVYIDFDPPQGDAMIGKVITQALNIRRQPNSNNETNKPIGQLQLNDIITADFENNGWWHILEITRAGVGVALPATDCFAYEGASNSYIQDITPPPTTDPQPPQEVLLRDDKGVTWRSTTFTRV